MMRCAWLATCAWAFAGVAWAAQPPRPELVFGQLPALDDLTISPSGRKVAVAEISGDDHRVTLIDRASGNQTSISLSTAPIKALRWATDNYLLITVGINDVQKRLFVADDDYATSRSLIYNLRDGSYKPLLSKASSIGGQLSLPIVHVADGAHPLVTVQGRAPTEHGSVPALWNVDPVTGDSRLLQEGDRNTAYWMLDASGEPRVWIERSTGETTPTVYARPKGTSDWTKLHIAEDLEVPLAYSDRDDAVYMLQRSDSGDQIKEVDLKTSTQTTVARAGKMESISLCLDEGREPTCIDRFDGTSHRKWIDPDFSQVSDQLDHAFGHFSYYFTSRDKNKCVYAIYTHGLEHPYAPYVYDCKTRALSPVGDEYPGLEIRRLGHVASLTYQTSDRSQIPAYLTLPPGTITSRPPLVVLLPPFGRYDSDIFDWRAQYMASLGYAVFQPQARGSSGFGYGFESAGFGQAGDKREQDIVDGVRHLAEKGMVDTTRVCVAGLETSGYTAMMALINHPDLFKCGFTIDGVSSPKMLLTEELAKFGDTQIDANFLTYLGFSKLGANGAVKSPLEGVGSLSRPLLIMASPNSTSIPYEQSVKMYKAALALKKNVNFVALPENSRNIGGAEARAATLTSIRDFLQANLSP